MNHGPWTIFHQPSTLVYPCPTHARQAHFTLRAVFAGHLFVSICFHSKFLSASRMSCTGGSDLMAATKFHPTSETAPRHSHFETLFRRLAGHCKLLRDHETFSIEIVRPFFIASPVGKNRSTQLTIYGFFSPRQHFATISR